MLTLSVTRIRVCTRANEHPSLWRIHPVYLLLTGTCHALIRRRLFGVSTLDVVRANTFVSESQGWAPDSTDVTVVGGHAGVTILPLLSQVKNAKFTPEQIAALNKRIQFGGDEVVQVRAKCVFLFEYLVSVLGVASSSGVCECIQ